PEPGDEDDPQTMNGYNYANNNPVMNIDPDGRAVPWYITAAAIGSGIGLGKYLWKYRKGGGTWKGALKATGHGALKGVMTATPLRILGIGGKLRVGKKILKGKSALGYARTVGTFSKALFRNPIKHARRTLVGLPKAKIKKMVKFSYKKKTVYKGKIVKKRYKK
ncbi:hypothetical protein DFP96_1412, partial [Listeria rocourtiae]